MTTMKNPLVIPRHRASQAFPAGVSACVRVVVVVQANDWGGERWIEMYGIYIYIYDETCVFVSDR